MCQAQKAVQESISPLTPEMNPTPMQGREIHKRSLSITLNSLPNGKKTKQTPASVPARCSSLSRLSLQGLPVELLEIIFLYSMNVALPRSSPLLGAKLSGKATLYRVFMAVFHDIFWEWSFAKCKGESNPMWSEELNNEERKEHDSIRLSLLSMPWADIDFILNAQQAWANKYAQGRSLIYDEDISTRYGAAWDISFAPAFRPQVLQHFRGESTFDARAWFEDNYERALAHEFYIWSFSEDMLLGIPTLVDHFVPVDLITGPWDEEKRRRLFWLARGNLDYVSDASYIDSLPVEVKLACIDAVVVSAENLDPLIANCLLGTWVFDGLPRDARHERLIKLCNRIDRGGEVVDIEILRFVVRHLDRNCEFEEYYLSSDGILL
ncbi:hypothetical protein E4U31_003262 [Claviceps sp. LM219 group G6]|nr:hypothetical protein E4U31_003262 [Claviceps sp. LM219 group G6]